MQFSRGPKEDSLPPRNDIPLLSASYTTEERQMSRYTFYPA